MEIDLEKENSDHARNTSSLSVRAVTKLIWLSIMYAIVYYIPTGQYMFIQHTEQHNLFIPLLAVAFTERTCIIDQESALTN